MTTTRSKRGGGIAQWCFSSCVQLQQIERRLSHKDSKVITNSFFMPFSGPLKSSCEATARPVISKTVGWGFKTSCRNVLPCSSFCDVKRDGGEVVLPEKVTLDKFWLYLQLFYSLRWSYFCSLEISFLGFLSRNF